MLRHFDAFLVGRYNRFGTPLAFRGTRAETEDELRRVAPRHPFLDRP